MCVCARALVLSQELRIKSPSQRVNIRLIIHATVGGGASLSLDLSESLNGY